MLLRVLQSSSGEYSGNMRQQLASGEEYAKGFHEPLSEVDQ